MLVVLVPSIMGALTYSNRIPVSLARQENTTVVFNWFPNEPHLELVER